MPPESDKILVANVPEDVETLRVEMTGYYAVQEPEGATAETLILALHGWGQNAKRFLRHFGPLKTSGLCVCAPQAPHQFYLDMENKKVGFNWLTVYDRPRAIADNCAFLAKLIQTLETRRKQPFQKRYVLGFSQGVSMAWRFAVSGLVPLDGVIHVAADLAPDVAAQLGEMPPIPVLLARGTGETLFASEVFEQAVAILEQHRYPVESRLFEGGHELNTELMDVIAQWLQQQAVRT